MSGNSFQEITSCTLIYSPPRKIHFPLQSWHNPMRILYWRIKSRAGKARWPEHSWTKSRGKVTTTHKTTTGCVRSHLRHPKTWVKKCVSRKIHLVINFWEENIITYTMFMQWDKIILIFHQSYPNLNLFKNRWVNPASESWERRAMTGFVLGLFFPWTWSNGINVIWTVKFQPEPKKSFAQFPCYLKSLSLKRLQF